MKIFLIIIGIIFWTITIVISYVTGLVRGFRLLSEKNVEKSKWETNLLSAFYKKNEDIDVFVKNKYVREQLDILKGEHQKEIESIKETIKSKKINPKMKLSKSELKKTPKKKTKKNVKK